jgi:small subunit ribosomal protein S4e
MTEKNKLKLIDSDASDSDKKVCQIIGKKVLKKGKVQLNLFDSRNIIVKEQKYKVGDSVMIEIPSQKVKDHFKLEKGSYVMMISGGHIGEHGQIEDVSKEGMVTIKSKKESFNTPKKSVFVIGKEKPALKMFNEK